MAEQRSSRPIVAPTIPPSSRSGTVQLPRMSSLPPPRELEELDEGWGEEGPSPGALTPPRAPALAERSLPAVTANPPVGDRHRTELEALRTALDDLRHELDEARSRIQLLVTRNAAAEAELDTARTAQHELSQQLEAARATQNELSQQLEAARATQHELTRQLETTHARTPTQGGDDLQAIKGIGPKLSKKLQEVGISTYADLADLDADGVAALAELLGIAKSRIERAGWVEAARQLAGASG